MYVFYDHSSSLALDHKSITPITFHHDSQTPIIMLSHAHQ